MKGRLFIGHSSLEGLSPSRMMQSVSRFFLYLPGVRYHGRPNRMDVGCS